MRRTRSGAIGKQANPEKVIVKQEPAEKKKKSEGLGKSQINNKPKYTPKIPLAQISKNSTLEKPFRSTQVLKATPKREKNENGLKCETKRSYPFPVQTEICQDRVYTEKRENGKSFENSDRGHSIHNNSFQRETHGLRTPSQPVTMVHEEEEVEEEFINDYGETSSYQQNGNSDYMPNAYNLNYNLEEMDDNTLLSTTEEISLALGEGNILEIGRTIRKGIQTGELSSVQIEELAKSLERPKVPLFAALIANERADFEDTKSIIAAMLFIEGLPAPHEKPLSRLQCSVNSLSHTVKAGSSLKLLEHRNLDTRHIINGTDEFQSIDLTKFYMNYRLTGDTPAFQMSSLLVQILKKSTYPRFQIWKYTFYPKSSKSADIHFHKTPEHIVESLKDFCFDVTGCFLPDDFLGDPIDESHWFMEKLPFNDARTEIIRRRKMRQPVLETFTMALWQALRTLRNYHYDLSSRQLLNCTSRGDCTSHLKWEHLKNFREKCRNEGVDQDDYTEQQLHDYAMVSSSSDPRNSSAHRNGSRVQQ
ncbi:hypothetical protein CRE_02244 [Caenorhabditis remanei]|uniref:Uncharacterized protein n=2 Tax=Caenorhabditis remanei TaxID=31234 RepID=E3LFU8_CAERE|nr:hypothetical protein CRE_02244 [Caenorhabditis remanei]